MEEIINDKINITEPIYNDDSIESSFFNEYRLQSLAGINTEGTELNFDIQACDRYLIPSESIIYITGRLLNNVNGYPPFAADNEIALVNNAMMYLFRTAEFQIGDKTIEHIDYPGQVTSILGYLNYPDDFNSSLSMCWLKDSTIHADSRKYNQSPAVAANAGIAAGNFTPIENPNYNKGFAGRKLFISPNGYFSFGIPFSHIFGFADYNKYIYNTKMTLRLTRAHDNLAVFKSAGVNTIGRIVLNDIKWRVREVKLAQKPRIKFMEFMKNDGKCFISYNRRTCQQCQIPANQRSHTWKLAVQAGIEKPRWIILGFQTDKIANQNQNPAIFDHVGLRRAIVNLNSERYPKSEFITNFERNDYCQLYNCMDNFKKEFHGFSSLIGGTQISFSDFKTLFPITVIDVRHQTETIKSGVIDVMLDLEFDQDIPANTHMFAIIISDSLYEYNSKFGSLTLVRK